MPKAPTAQHALDAVAPMQDCARRNRFHHHRSRLPHCFLSDYSMGNGACWYNDLHLIPTMLAYLPSALYTKCTDMSSVGLPCRKMVLFYSPEAIKRPGAQRTCQTCRTVTLAPARSPGSARKGPGNLLSHQTGVKRRQATTSHLTPASKPHSTLDKKYRETSLEAAFYLY